MTCDDCQEAEDDALMFGKEGATGKTPCHICPVPRYRILSPRNRQAFAFWEELSQTGRDLGFGFGTIRMEAIHAILSDERQEGNELYTGVRQKIIEVEGLMYPYLQKQSEKDQEQKKVKNEQKALHKKTKATKTRPIVTSSR